MIKSEKTQGNIMKKKHGKIMKNRETTMNNDEKKKKQQ
jgi:hypothetical protein